MSVIATAVRHLMAAGVTGEALVEAIAEMEAAQPKDAVAEKRRAYDRERKALKRAEAKSGGSPVESADTADIAPLSRPLSPQTPLTPTHTPGSKQRARKAEHPIPDGWAPILTPAAQRTVDGWPPGMFERQLARFLDHAADKGRTSKDWQAAFRTWISNADERIPRNDRPPPCNDEPQNPYVRAVVRREAERAAAQH